MTDTPTDEQYDAAIERLIAMYAENSEPFVSMIETVRDEETVHETNHSVNEARHCVDGCMGCFTEHLADVITRAAVGGSPSKPTQTGPELCDKEGRS